MTADCNIAKLALGRIPVEWAVKRIADVGTIVRGSSPRPKGDPRFYGGVVPRLVGLLFFNEHPAHFFPATQIDVVWFPEGAGGGRFVEKTFSGPLAQITRDALSHIQTNYLKQTVVKRADRAEADRFWNFPYPAVEEAVVNAVYHRSYEIREPIEIRITRDDLVVLSFPGPDRSIRIEELRQGKAVARRYRNRRVGEFLKELDLTEGRSTGISKILRVLEENGSPPPEFETDTDRSFFLIRMPVHPLAESSVPEVTPEVLSMLLVMQGDMSRSEIMDALGLKDEKHFREHYQQAGIASGVIEMTQPDKPRSSKQRYRMTADGKSYLLGKGKGRRK